MINALAYKNIPISAVVSEELLLKPDMMWCVKMKIDVELLLGSKEAESCLSQVLGCFSKSVLYLQNEKGQIYHISYGATPILLVLLYNNPNVLPNTNGEKWQHRNKVSPIHRVQTNLTHYWLYYKWWFLIECCRLLNAEQFGNVLRQTEHSISCRGGYLGCLTNNFLCKKMFAFESCRTV